jgi:hypothetical protein
MERTAKFLMKPVAKKEGLVLQELPGEVLIYDTAKNRAYCLNETSAFVWKACDGENSVDQISRMLAKEFKAPVNEDLVWLALDQLGKDELLSETPKSRFEGMTRRDVIRKVGFASMIALPVVASLMAPTAAMAVACSSGICGCTGCNDNTPCRQPIGGCTITGICLGQCCFNAGNGLCN